MRPSTENLAVRLKAIAFAKKTCATLCLFFGGLKRFKVVNKPDLLLIEICRAFALGRLANVG